MSNSHNENKKLLEPFREALYNYEPQNVKQMIDRLFGDEATIHLCHPFGDLTKGDFFKKAYEPLAEALPDLERRDIIVMAGEDVYNKNWVGCAGYYTGTFKKPWLDIPPTGHQVALRFHEFYEIKDGKVVQVQAIWDIIEVMIQANAWVMSPSLGREWHVPAPATQDGIITAPYDAERSSQSLKLVEDMLNGLGKHAEGGPEAMGLEKYWHPKFSWYGPSGIGTCRGIAGFRNWHQIPFLNALPNRVCFVDKSHFFADDNYVGFTGWPGMQMTVSGDGWLGIAPSDQEITMRSLDFWRCENGLLRENWVLIDIIDVYRQIGVDVFARLKEFNKARNI